MEVSILLVVGGVLMKFHFGMGVERREQFEPPSFRVYAHVNYVNKKNHFFAFDI